MNFEDTGRGRLNIRYRASFNLDRYGVKRIHAVTFPWDDARNLVDQVRLGRYVLRESLMYYKMRKTFP
jgi:hypothetical protein